MAGNNNVHRGPQKDKPFRDALRRSIAEASGDPDRLNRIARALYSKAEDGDVNAIREIADRLDGKPAQSHSGDDDGPPIAHVVTWKQQP